jgi:hypothetical protein
LKWLSAALWQGRDALETASLSPCSLLIRTIPDADDCAFWGRLPEVALLLSVQASVTQFYVVTLDRAGRFGTELTRDGCDVSEVDGIGARVGDGVANRGRRTVLSADLSRDVMSRA